MCAGACLPVLYSLLATSSNCSNTSNQSFSQTNPTQHQMLKPPLLARPPFPNAHARTCTQGCTHSLAGVRMHIPKHMRAPTYKLASARARAHTHTRTHTHTQTHTHTHTHTYTHTHTHTHTTTTTTTNNNNNNNNNTNTTTITTIAFTNRIITTTDHNPPPPPPAIVWIRVTREHVPRATFLCYERRVWPWVAPKDSVKPIHGKSGSFSR